ncbi:TonB-dependent receptor [Shewanella marina]|uniref:TonB-dependent receptor n=1 Tax=Shewanella marina TaxID=487319 RepID=UPI00047028D9
MLFTRSTIAHAVSSVLLFTPMLAVADDKQDIEVITVTSDFRETTLAQTPTSVSVIDAQQIKDEGAQHFEDILNSFANLNWSGGSSRPKYFQIRGVGEQEQYLGAPNSSVGYIFDDIDLSGLGMVASMYDLQQAEVLRGPQGTRFGANALAGVIYLKSNDPTEYFEHGGKVSVGNDQLTTFSGYSSGPLTDSGNLLYRVALEQHNQNGYRDNIYLNRDDTNERDELSLRAKLRWLASDDLQFDLTLLHADFNNGYDAWTLDNNGFETTTDEPGKDSQRTSGAGLKVSYQGIDGANLTSLTSIAKTEHHHGYDGDWSNPDYWAGKLCGAEPCEYDYTWNKRGDRQTLSQELRLSSDENGKIWHDSTDWLVGIYAMKLTEDNHTIELYNAWPDELEAKYEAENYAVFGQLDSDLGHDFSLSIGIRFEQRESEYRDSAGDHFDPSENMWGGHIALAKQFSTEQQGYIRVARGYKAGGFNMSLPTELSDKKEYDTEILYNYEIGLKSSWLGGDAQTNLAVFFMQRQDQQVAASTQDPVEPQKFILYTENAGSSHNYGAEIDGQWQLNSNLKVYGSLGWLETAYGDYIYQDKYGGFIDLSGRKLAHSPRWSYSLGTTYVTDSGWFINMSGAGKSAFYYSDSNDSQSSSYTIFNAKLGYETERWSAYLWGRNLFDKHYGVRGFYFGNEPDIDWADKQYIRFGDPRQFGMTLSIDF